MKAINERFGTSCLRISQSFGSLLRGVLKKKKKKPGVGKKLGKEGSENMW